jgi:hypothetical protein
VGFASCVEDCDRSIAIELDFEDPIWRSKGVFALSAIIGGTKSGKVFFGIWRVSQRKAIMLAVNISKLVQHPALAAKRKKFCMTNPDRYQTPPTFVGR